MQKVLFVWDARDPVPALTAFIDRLKASSANYETECHFLSLGHFTDKKAPQCKYSLRALLDQIYLFQPDLVVSFGVEANILLKLLKPALKVPLICNILPEAFEAASVTRRKLDSVSRKFTDTYSWLPADQDCHFIPTLEPKSLFHGRVAVMSDDPCASVISTLVQQHRLPRFQLYREEALHYFDSLFETSDLLVISHHSDPDGRLIWSANAAGLPVVLISESNMTHLIRDGYNGWHVHSTEDARLGRCLHNWQNMSKDARKMMSRYAQAQQSSNSGLDRFLQEIGLIKTSSADIYPFPTKTA